MPKKIGTNEFNIVSLTTMTFAQNAVDTKSRRRPRCALISLLKHSCGRRPDFKIEHPASHRCRIADVEAAGLEGLAMFAMSSFKRRDVRAASAGLIGSPETPLYFALIVS